jgi:transcriptional regulator with XRE-family HTH domain
MTGIEINKYLLLKSLKQSDFALKLDTAQPTVSRWIKSETNLSNSSINKILNAFPDFDEVINSTEGVSTRPVVNEKSGVYNKATRLSVLDVNDLEDFMNEKTPSKGSIDISDFVDATGSMLMKGDSMGGSMTVNGGDILAHKEWHPRSYYDYGNIHVIFTRDHMFIRYLKKHKDKGMVLLKAKNDFFDDIDLPISEIKRVYVVNAAIVQSS